MATAFLGTERAYDREVERILVKRLNMEDGIVSLRKGT